METEQTKQAWLQGTIPTEGEGMAHTQMQPSHTHTNSPQTLPSLLPLKLSLSKSHW